MGDCLYYTIYAPFILAPLGLIKGIVFGLPACLIATVTTACVVLFFLPYHVILAAKVTWTTAYVGPNVRFLLLLFFPLTMIVYPVVLVLAFFLICFGFNVFGIGASVFRDECGDDGEPGILEHYKETYDWTKQVYKFARNEFPRVAPDLCHVPQNWDGSRYEISFAKLVVGAILLVYGTVVGLVVISVIGILKFPFAVFRLNKEYLRLCFTEWAFYWFFFELFGFVLLNCLVVPLALCVALPIYGIMTGIQCVGEALRTDSMKEGFRECLRIFREFDLYTTCHFILDGSRDEEDCYSCIPAVSDRRPTEIYSVENTKNDMDVIFQKFEKLGLAVTREALKKEWIREADISDLEPFLMIGIPGLTAFNIILRSVEESRGKAEIVCQLDSQEQALYHGSSSQETQRTITAETKPNNGIAFVFWPKIMKAKRALESTGDSLSEKEIEWMRCKILTNSADHITKPSEEILEGMNDEKRRGELTRKVISEFQSLAIDTSRLERVGRMITHISESISGTVESDSLDEEETTGTDVEE